ncbi:MAG: hypothetical protein JWQ07_5903 [Ramlibacter sp.]|nr:hypothetical protein [Ramlibacter sp.]
MRRVFYSFHYDDDVMRVSQVRQMGALQGQPLLESNKWEAIRRGGSAAIQRWIDSQMQGKDCLVVLIGQRTATRAWVKYEIEKAWSLDMGVVGIHVHGLKDPRTRQASPAGPSPFPAVMISGYPRPRPLSAVAKTYTPQAGAEYAWIERHLVNAVEEAIKIRLVN